MRSAGLMVFIALLALAIPAGSAGPVDLARPVAAFASADTSGASIIWIPGVQTPSEYIVLGGSPGELVPIETVPGTQFSIDVKGTYATYAVESVVDGVTSDPVVAMVLSGCTRVELNPPGIHDGCDTPTSVPAKLSVEFGILGSML